MTTAVITVTVFPSVITPAFDIGQTSTAGYISRDLNRLSFFIARKRDF
jgi:hypothetical protein